MKFKQEGLGFFCWRCGQFMQAPDSRFHGARAEISTGHLADYPVAVLTLQGPPWGSVFHTGNQVQYGIQLVGNSSGTFGMTFADRQL